MLRITHLETKEDKLPDRRTIATHVINSLLDNKVIKESEAKAALQELPCSANGIKTFINNILILHGQKIRFHNWYVNDLIERIEYAPSSVEESIFGDIVDFIRSSSFYRKHNFPFHVIKSENGRDVEERISDYTIRYLYNDKNICVSAEIIGPRHLLTPSIIKYCSNSIDFQMLCPLTPKLDLLLERMCHDWSERISATYIINSLIQFGVLTREEAIPYVSFPIRETILN